MQKSVGTLESSFRFHSAKVGSPYFFKDCCLVCRKVVLSSTLRIKEFFMRNGHPYSYVDLERDRDVQELLDSFQVSASEIPILIFKLKISVRICLTRIVLPLYYNDKTQIHLCACCQYP
jgi:hypothetical protein